MSRSASARSRAGRGTTGARSRTRWFCGLPLLQRGGLQNFSTSGVSLIDRITCGSYTVVALGPDPPSVWRSVVSRSLNKVMLIGNLGADPEVRSTNNGSRVATVSLATSRQWRSEEHTSELQSHHDLVCRLLLEKKKNKTHLKIRLINLIMDRSHFFTDSYFM